jgi:hypothetical protein
MATQVWRPKRKRQIKRSMPVADTVWLRAISKDEEERALAEQDIQRLLQLVEQALATSLLCPYEPVSSAGA